MKNTQWLEWAQNLQAIAQSGLTYTTNPFEIERYKKVQKIAAEMIAQHTDEDLDEILNLFDQQSGYATPKVDVRGVVFQDDKILLVRELMDGGKWTLPGGWVDVNDQPSSAAEREVWEESGYQVKAKKLLAVYDRNKHGHPAYIFHIFKFYFECELIGGQPANSIETSDAAFFAEEEIPELSIARTTPEVLHRIFTIHLHPDWPTDFD